MILQCPACNARYAVPDHAIGANGRTVRCVKCAHQWFQAGVQAENIAALEALLKAPEQPVAKPIPKSSNVPAAKKHPSSVLKGALAASFVLALVATLFSQKPGWFGFAPTHDLVLSDLSLAKQEVERGMEYAVSGKLKNASKSAQKPPVIRITLVDKEGAPMQYWQPSTPEVIDAGADLPFTFGPLKTKFTTGDRLVVEIGSPLELSMRRKP
ncbi:MAG: zinc-ribbon domain-containing protein [Alphaproteobacteria bacterium]|nr:zinc-ribbon domain-containing protein [Alphaproteobacteria bacterium]